VKTHASCEAATAAVDEVLAIARRAAEERGVQLVAIGAKNAADHAHIYVDYVGCSPTAALELAGIGIGAVHSRAHVDFGAAGIHKAMERGFDSGQSILRTPPGEGIARVVRLVPKGDAS
jgi:hypothetical protein